MAAVFFSALGQADDIKLTGKPYIDMNYWANKQRNEFVENISGGAGGPDTGVTSDKVIFKFAESEGKRMYDLESKNLRNFTRQSASYNTN